MSFQPFFVIPKSPKNQKNKNHYWRIDFHDQEKNILKGAKKEYVKPLIKLLKVMSRFMKYLSAKEIKKNLSSFVTPTTP